MAKDRYQTEVSFDEQLVGRHADADGGSHVPGTNFGARQAFSGTLTGRRMTQGDPPWHFLELSDLTEKPEGFEHDAVWCHEADVYLDEA